MKKRNLRIISSGFTYGAVIGMLLFLVNTPPDSVLPQTLKILLVAAICAVVSGIVITGILFLLEIFRAKKYASCRAELTEESILLEDAARRLVRENLVKGQLFLTSKNLVFCSGQKEIRRISLSEIAQVQITDPKKGQITVTTDSTESEVYAVYDALTWFNAIGEGKEE